MTAPQHLTGEPPRRRRRQHPARGARAAALLASIGATGAIGAAMVLSDGPAATSAVDSAAAAAPAEATPSTTAGSVRSASAMPRATSPAASTPLRARTTGYRDGVFTGPAEPTRWGDLQVQVTITAGRITSVRAVRSPTDGKSPRINARAQPILEQEAIAANSAHIDMVSGATYTSTTYTRSLQAALDAAAVTAKRTNAP